MIESRLAIVANNELKMLVNFVIGFTPSKSKNIHTLSETKIHKPIIVSAGKLNPTDTKVFR